MKRLRDSGLGHSIGGGGVTSRGDWQQGEAPSRPLSSRWQAVVRKVFRGKVFGPVAHVVSSVLLP